MSNEAKVTTAERTIQASRDSIFELIADPAEQPRWDGNGNLAVAAEGQRVTSVGEVFEVTLTTDDIVRENEVVEFAEGKLIAWKPRNPGEMPFGQLWRWELEDTSEPGVTLVRHTYDWSGLPADTMPRRLERARNTSEAMLMASIDRLAELAESISTRA